MHPPLSADEAAFAHADWLTRLQLPTQHVHVCAKAGFVCSDPLEPLALCECTTLADACVCTSQEI